MTRRRDLFLAAAGAALAVRRIVRAQPAALPLVGYVSGRTRSGKEASLAVPPILLAHANELIE